VLPETGEGRTAPLVALLPEGDARRGTWWRHRLAVVEAERDVLEFARRFLRAESERYVPWLLNEARTDLAQAFARLDAARREEGGQ
jgi:hypothetical protein